MCLTGTAHGFLCDEYVKTCNGKPQTGNKFILLQL